MHHASLDTPSNRRSFYITYDFASLKNIKDYIGRAHLHFLKIIPNQFVTFVLIKIKTSFFIIPAFNHF